MIGDRWSARSHEVKDFLTRNLISFRWHELERDSEALAPIVRLDDPRLAETVRQVRAAGAAGLSFFAYRPGLEDRLRERARAWRSG